MASRFRWRLFAVAAGAIPVAGCLFACGARAPLPPEPPSAVRRGDEAFRVGAWDAAVASYRSHLDKSYFDEYTPRSAYKLALAQYQLKRYADVVSTIEELDRNYPETKWVQVEALRGDAERELGRPIDAIRAWDRGWVLGTDAERNKLSYRIRPVVRGLNGVELAAARREVRTDEVAEMIDRQIELRQRPLLDEPMPEMTGDQAPARSRVEELEEEMPPPAASDSRLSPAPETESAPAVVAEPEPAEAAEPEPETPTAAPTPTATYEPESPPPVVERPVEHEGVPADETAVGAQAGSRLESPTPSEPAGLVRVPVLRSLQKPKPDTSAETVPAADEAPAEENVPAVVEFAPTPSPTPEPTRTLVADVSPPEAPVFAMPAPAREPAPDQRQPVYARPADAPPANLVVDRGADRGTSAASAAMGTLAGKIGCLLPLTGEARELGERSLDGIRLALGDEEKNLVVRDTGSDSATAVSMFSALVSDPNVKVVLGPVRGADAERVAPLAERAQLPLLLLSQLPGIGGRFVTQVAMTRSQMLATLLDYALTTARIRNVGIVYPNDTDGQEMLVAVRREVERRGGAVVGSFGYSATTREQVADVIRKWRDERRAQGIFLPDGVAAAAGVARYMQREMPEVTLLGVHDWEGLVGPGQGDAEGLSGVLFADAFLPTSRRAGTRRFVDAFEKSYGHAPGTVEAQAYDAALLAKQALSSGARERMDVQQDLHAIGPIEGATGELTITPRGLERRLFLLRVTDGELGEVGDR